MIRPQRGWVGESHPRTLSGNAPESNERNAPDRKPDLCASMWHRLPAVTGIGARLSWWRSKQSGTAVNEPSLSLLYEGGRGGFLVYEHHVGGGDLCLPR
ncbi:hypothetical protein BRIN106911_19660 [Brevibacillus invocatus]